MKKSIFITFLLCVLAVGRLSAQAPEDPYYGGEKGDWSVGFNLLTTDSNYQIRGTYMLTDRLVIDAGVRIENSSSIREYGDSDYDSKGEITWEYTMDNKTRIEEYSLGINYLLRPGERLQSFVGGMLSLSKEFAYSKYDYNQEVSTGRDNLSETNNWMYGLCAVFGVDYFFTPRVSLGGRISVGGFVTDSQYKSSSGNFDEELLSTEHGLYGLKFRTHSSAVLLSFYF